MRRRTSTIRAFVAGLVMAAVAVWGAMPQGLCFGQMVGASCCKQSCGCCSSSCCANHYPSQKLRTAAACHCFVSPQNPFLIPDSNAKDLSLAAAMVVQPNSTAVAFDASYQLSQHLDPFLPGNLAPRHNCVLRI